MTLFQCYIPANIFQRAASQNKSSILIDYHVNRRCRVSRHSLNHWLEWCGTAGKSLHINALIWDGPRTGKNLLPLNSKAVRDDSGSKVEI